MSFLTTRVTSPNEEDERKLFRVLKYLRGSRDLALTLTGSKNKPVQLWQDNQLTICLARRGKSTSNRTRHVTIRYFFIKERMDSGEVEISYLPTERMVADFFTKPLQGAVFLQHRAMVMNLCSFEKPSLISCWGVLSDSIVRLFVAS